MFLRYILRGSLRDQADMCRVIHEEIHTPCLTLPHFCPNCDYAHDRKLWFRRGAYMFCNNCGYRLQKSDYWLSELGDEFPDDFQF